MKNISCNIDYIVFDLDDTLINTKNRHYQIYSDFLYLHSITPLQFQDYLNMRADGISNRGIIALHARNLVSPFEDFWKTSIENSNYLALDTCTVESLLLAELKKITATSFILLSLRSNKQTAKNQFKSFPFSALFDMVVFLKHATNTNPKANWLKKFNNSKNIRFFIGDTNSDAEASLQNNILFLGVETGWKRPFAEFIFTDINSLLNNLCYEYKAKT